MSSKQQYSNHRQRYHSDQSRRCRQHSFNCSFDPGFRGRSYPSYIFQQHRKRNWLLQCSCDQRCHILSAKSGRLDSRYLHVHRNAGFFCDGNLRRGCTHHATPLCALPFSGCGVCRLPTHLLYWSTIYELAFGACGMVEQLRMGWRNDSHRHHATEHRPPDWEQPWQHFFSRCCSYWNCQ